jgi:hypothetical protein
MAVAAKFAVMVSQRADVIKGLSILRAISNLTNAILHPSVLSFLL